MELKNKGTTNEKVREPLKCWGCGEPHLLGNCPQNIRPMNNLQVAHEATT